MAETLSVHIASLADIGSLSVYLHNELTGVLINAGGDLLTHIAGGLFTAVLDEDRTGLGNLYAVICDGAELPENVMWEGWLGEGSVLLQSAYPGGDATLAKQQQILNEVQSLGSSMTEAY